MRDWILALYGFGFLFLLNGFSNLLFGGGFSMLGWSKAIHPQQEALMDFALGILPLLLAVYLQLRKKRQDKSKN